VTTPNETATTDLVREVWAESLGLSDFGPHDDFFEWGGHSLMVAAAVARLSERLGIDLPLRALFEAPTPAEMAELIAEQRAAPAGEPAAGITPFFPDWVVPLQAEGTGRPVFVFPAGHHELTALAIEARVAVHVGRDHPFWGFGREDPQLTIARSQGVAALAAAGVAQIRAIQPDGPYLLSGNCSGGYLAWETARQLLAAGERIAGVLFFEVPLRAGGSSPWEHYQAPALPIDLTHVMTRMWHDRAWGTPWEEVALGSYASVIIPGETERAFERRDERVAQHVRDWLEQAEARIRGV
jgi:thioesterase domain-containing protein/acyl carrier protein